MKNLLKKTVSILTVLAMLLGGITAFADELAETEWVELPTFEIGGGMNGTLDPTAEVRTHAGRRGDVLFTLTLTEGCDISVAWDGNALGLTRPDESVPVYTFIRHVEWDEYHVVSMTAGRRMAYALTSEILPPEPVPEKIQEEAIEEISQEEPQENPQEEIKEQQNEETNENSVEETQGDSQETVSEQPEADDAEEQPAVETDSRQEQQEIPDETEQQDESSHGTPENAESSVIDTESAIDSNESDMTYDEPEDSKTEEIEPEQVSEQQTDTDTADITEQPVDETSQAENRESPEETDLPEKQNPDENTDEETGPESIEIIIDKTVKPGDTWEKTLRRNKPVILKLEVDEAQNIHLILEGSSAWCSVQKSDIQTEDVQKVYTDPETKRVLVEWSATGTYLVTIGSGEEALLMKTKVLFLDDTAFEVWLAENEIPDNQEDKDTTEEDTSETPEGTPDGDENEPDSIDETAEENEEEPVLPEERSVTFSILWDTEDPVIGDTAHLVATLSGYDTVEHSLQWQYSLDDSTWIDVPDATTETLDIVTTEENNFYYWRVMVYVYPPEDNEE